MEHLEVSLLGIRTERSGGVSSAFPLKPDHLQYITNAHLRGSPGRDEEQIYISRHLHMFLKACRIGSGGRPGRVWLWPSALPWTG